MSDTLFIILVLLVAAGGVLGVAYMMDKRDKKSKPVDHPLPELGPIGRMLLWGGRVFIVLAVLSVIGAFVFNSLPFVGLAASCIALYILSGIIYRIVRPTGR